jgi:hypothetical protein
MNGIGARNRCQPPEAASGASLRKSLGAGDDFVGLTGRGGMAFRHSVDGVF